MLIGEQALLGVDPRFGSQGEGLHPCLFFFSGPGLLWKGRSWDSREKAVS